MFAGTGGAARSCHEGERYGGNVIVTEVDPVKAIEAVMDGFRVMKLEQAMPFADIVVTVTGNVNVVDEKHLRTARTGQFCKFRALQQRGE